MWPMAIWCDDQWSVWCIAASLFLRNSKQLTTVHCLIQRLSIARLQSLTLWEHIAILTVHFPRPEKAHLDYARSIMVEAHRRSRLLRSKSQQNVEMKLIKFTWTKTFRSVEDVDMACSRQVRLEFEWTLSIWLIWRHYFSQFDQLDLFRIPFCWMTQHSAKSQEQFRII